MSTPAAITKLSVKSVLVATLCAVLTAAAATATTFDVETLNADIVFWPSLAIDAQGDAHLATYYIRSSEYGIAYLHRHDGVWTEEEVTPSIGSYVSLALDSAGAPHVVYYEGGTPKYASRVDGSWVIEAIGQFCVLDQRRCWSNERPCRDRPGRVF